MEYCNCSVACYTAYGDHYNCGNTGCNTHENGGCSTHENRGCSTHENSGCSTHDNGGCYTHDDSGYNNHSNDGYNNHSNYTDNYDPNLTGVVSGDGSVSYNTNIPLIWPAATHSLAPGQSAQTITYYLYYKYKAPGGSFGNWVVPHFASTVATSYNWNTTTMPAGEYIVRVKAWDGQEWNDDGGTIAPASMNATEVNRSGIDSAALVIVHYKAPSWTNVINDNQTRFLKTDIDEVRREVTNARDAFVLPAPTFTDPTITTNITKIKAVHITELRTNGDALRAAAGKPAFTFSRSIAAGGTRKGIDLKEIRAVLESL